MPSARRFGSYLRRDPNRWCFSQSISAVNNPNESLCGEHVAMCISARSHLSSRGSFAAQPHPRPPQRPSGDIIGSTGLGLFASCFG